MTELEAIQALLWEKWDPIGVNDEPAAFGEYDRYAAEVHSMLIRGANAEEIARHLDWVATELIGLGSNVQHCLAVARLAVDINTDRQRI
ncbi:MAG: hypothetical protein ACO1NN_10680 [Sphingopyxis sp.]